MGVGKIMGGWLNGRTGSVDQRSSRAATFVFLGLGNRI